MSEMGYSLVGEIGPEPAGMDSRQRMMRGVLIEAMRKERARSMLHYIHEQERHELTSKHQSETASLAEKLA